MYLFNPSSQCNKQFNRFAISFPSPRPVAILRLKSTVCPTIYL